MADVLSTLPRSMPATLLGWAYCGPIFLCCASISYSLHRRLTGYIISDGDSVLGPLYARPFSTKKMYTTLSPRVLLPRLHVQG